MKGNYNEECNITSCQKPNSATWFNHFNQRYYCANCANRLNNDEFNKRSALEELGHNMCTEIKESKVKPIVIVSVHSNLDYVLHKASLQEPPTIVTREENFERGITFNIKNPLEVLCDNIIRDADIKLTEYGENYQSGRESRRARRKEERKSKNKYDTPR